MKGWIQDGADPQDCLDVDEVTVLGGPVEHGLQEGPFQPVRRRLNDKCTKVYQTKN